MQVELTAVEFPAKSVRVRVDRKGRDENYTNRRQLLWSPALTIGLRAPAFLDGQQKLAGFANEVFKG